MKKIEKILQFIDNQRITKSAFEQKSGLSNGYLRNISISNSEVSGKMLSKMYAAYPNLENYLESSQSIVRHSRKVPIIGEAAAGTELEINVDDSRAEMEYIDVGDMLRDSEAAFTVYGNSMNPNYPSGCILGIRRNFDNFIQPGEIYLLVTRSNRVFKRLYYNEDKTGFMCYSDNTIEYDKGSLKGKAYYPPFEVKAADVVSIYDVVGMIKRTRNSGVIMRQN